jgi:hypothetical protein
MTRTLIAAAITAGTLIAVATPASACPHGYKTVVIQGNSICQLDASASTKLKAATSGGQTQSSAQLKRTR